MQVNWELRIDTDNVQHVSVAADFLCMDKLKLFCEEFLIGQLDSTNVLNFRDFGQFFCFKNLVSSADKYIASNFSESTSTQGFLSLTKDKVVCLMSRSDLKVKMEEEIFEACKRWVKENSKTRSQSISDLYNKLDLL